jgi:hypothetical protein
MTKLSQILLAGAAVPMFTSAATAQPSVVDLDTALRCSAAFGIAAAEQARGVGTARTDYPALNQRGREFFVQTGARLMDAQKLDRPAVQQRLQAEVAKLQTEISSAADPAARFKAIMTPCLAVLDLTVPLRR